MSNLCANLDRQLGDLRGRIIDMHAHPVPDDATMLPMVEQAKRAGIEKLYLLGCGLPPGERWLLTGSLVGVPTDPTQQQIQEFNADAIRWKERFPDLFEAYVYVNPHHGAAAVKDVEIWVLQHGAIGVKMVWCREPDGRLDTTIAVVAKAAELRVPVLFHTFFRTGGVQEGEITPEDVAMIAKACPDAKIIMAHLGGDWIRAARTVKHLPNVYGDTSGCTWRTGWTEFVVRELGAERVLFGADIPARSFGPQIAKILVAEITPDQRRAIFRDNAERLFFA